MLVYNVRDVYRTIVMIEYKVFITVVEVRVCVCEAQICFNLASRLLLIFAPLHGCDRLSACSYRQLAVYNVVTCTKQGLQDDHFTCHRKEQT